MAQTHRKGRCFLNSARVLGGDLSACPSKAQPAPWSKAETLLKPLQADWKELEVQAGSADSLGQVPEQGGVPRKFWEPRSSRHKGWEACIVY